MTFNIGDRVRPSKAAVFRDRKIASYVARKRTAHMTGTILSVLHGQNEGRYNVRWDTPGQAFLYYDVIQAESLLEPYWEA